MWLFSFPVTTSVRDTCISKPQNVSEKLLLGWWRHLVDMYIKMSLSSRRVRAFVCEQHNEYITITYRKICAFLWVYLLMVKCVWIWLISINKSIFYLAFFVGISKYVWNHTSLAKLKNINKPLNAVINISEGPQ